MQWSRHQRAEALLIARTEGDAVASQKTGIPRATVRHWRWQEAKRESAVQGRTEGAGGAHLGSPQQSQTPSATTPPTGRVVARDVERTARRALKRLEASLKAGKTLDAQRLVIVLGTAIDKGLLLSRQEATDEATRAAVTDQQHDLMVRAMGEVFDRVGLSLPECKAVARLLVDVVGRLERDGVVAASPELAEAARREVLERVGCEVRAGIEADVRRRYAPEIAERRGLPAPVETDDTGDGYEPDEMAPPIVVEVDPNVHVASSGDPNVRLAADVARERARAGTYGLVVRAREPVYGPSEFS